MAARKRRTEVRREQILREALAVVSRGGLSALSVAGVAGRCGLVPSALYRHFGGRGDLLDALVLALEERLRRNVAAAAAAPDALARLRRLYDLHLEMAGGGAALPRVVFSDDVLGSPRRRRALDAVLRDYLGAVAALLEEGRRAGTVRHDVDPVASAGLFLGAVQHAAVLAHAGGRDFDLPAHAERVWKQLARGLAAPSRRARIRLLPPSRSPS